MDCLNDEWRCSNVPWYEMWLLLCRSKFGINFFYIFDLLFFHFDHFSVQSILKLWKKKQKQNKRTTTTVVFVSIIHCMNPRIHILKRNENKNAIHVCYCCCCFIVFLVSSRIRMIFFLCFSPNETHSIESFR